MRLLLLQGLSLRVHLMLHLLHDLLRLMHLLPHLLEFERERLRISDRGAWWMRRQLTAVR